MARPSIGVDFKMKAMFFDRQAVIRDLDRRERAALIRIGSFVRTRARSLIRSRKRKPKRGRPAKLSQQGEPPISWQKPGLKNILFHYDSREKSVVIGPVQFNHGQDVPGLLELGGMNRITESRYYDRRMPWHPGEWQNGPVETRQRSVNIEARPFMGPALEKEQDTILDAFEWAAKRR